MMPSVSKKQHNLMEAVAHSPAFAKKVGIPQSVGKDFVTADKGKKFKEGGTMKKMKKFAGGGEMIEEMASKYAGQRGMSGMPDDTHSYGEASAKMKRLGAKPNSADYRLGMKTLTGGTTRKALEDLVPKMPKSYDEESGMKKGGKVMEKESKSESKKEMAMDKKQDVAMIKKAFKQHDKQEHKGSKGTTLKLSSGGSFRSSANGIAQRGLTKGKMVTMCGGGMMKKGK
jgi:hypothetical protein